MIEPFEQPQIETQYGGPALADEVCNAMGDITEVLNELIAFANAQEARNERVETGMKLILGAMIMDTIDLKTLDKIKHAIEGK